MRQHGGLGLAAPQVGINARLFVAHWGEVFVNPLIVESVGSYLAVEGCLSLPGVAIECCRYQQDHNVQRPSLRGARGPSHLARVRPPQRHPDHGQATPMTESRLDHCRRGRRKRRRRHVLEPPQGPLGATCQPHHRLVRTPRTPLDGRGDVPLAALPHLAVWVSHLHRRHGVRPAGEAGPGGRSRSRRQSGRLYWCGWLPLWFATLPTDDKAALRVGNEYYWGGSKLVFLRGTLNPDKLLTDALAEYNHFQANSDGAGKTRYQIHHIFGTAGKPISLLGSDTTRRDSELKATSDSNLTTQRTLQWKPGDLGASRMNHGNALRKWPSAPRPRRWWKRSDAG